MPYCQLYKLLRTCWLKLWLWLKLLFHFQEEDHYVLASKTRQLARPSKKWSSAQLKLQELAAFPDYKVILNKENNNI